MKTVNTAARDAARKANARAFLKDKPKPGKPWASKTYVYDRASSVQEEPKR